MDYLNNLPYCLIGAIGSILIAKNLLNEKFNKSTLYNAIVIFIYVFLSTMICKENYTPLQTMLEFLALNLSIKMLFDLNIIKVLATAIITMIVVAVSEATMLINFLFVKNLVFIRSSVLLFSATNLCTMIIGNIISHIKIIKKIANKFINMIEKNKLKFELFMITFFLIIILFFSYQIFTTRYIENNQIILVLFTIILSIICLIFIYEKIQYNNLDVKYKLLLEHACSFEEELDKDKLLRHECKNQLAVIRDMTKNQKVIKYINGLLESYKNDGYRNIKGISNLPKGGLRGIVYYKICIIINKHIDYSIDISRTAKNKLSKLTIDEVKALSYIIGVCSDNAIEECCENNTHANISFEVYAIENEINIIISNTIINKINVKTIGKKGYSTKGPNHGNGLFLAKKFLNNYKNMSLTTKIINNYCIQTIKIRS